MKKLLAGISAALMMLSVSGCMPAATADGEAAAGGSNATFWIIYLVIIGAFFYFMLIKPQQKQKKQQAELYSSMAIGDSVLTTAGFYGVIIDMTDDTVIVEFGSNKNCRIPMQKAAIVQIEKPNYSNTASSGEDK